MSVVIPFYNCQQWIEATLRSVFAQTYSDFEVIVVDDGSEAGAADVLEPYSQAGRIRYIRQSNRGVSATRNAGVRHARGMYIAFLDADDLWVETKLEEQVASLQDSGAALVFSDSYIVDEGEQLLTEKRMPVYANSEHLLINTLFGRVAHFTSSLLVRKDVFLEVGGFAEHLSLREDHLFLMDVAGRYPVTHIPKPLSKKRVCTGSLTFGLQSRDPEGVYERSREFVYEAVRRHPLLAVYQNRALSKLSRALALLLLRKGQKKRSLRFLLRATRHDLRQTLDPKAWAIFALIATPWSYRLIRRRNARDSWSSEVPWLPAVPSRRREDNWRCGDQHSGERSSPAEAADAVLDVESGGAGTAIEPGEGLQGSLLVNAEKRK